MDTVRPRTVTIAVAAVATLAAAASLAIVVASRRDDGSAERSAQFQALVGGLGTGAVLDLSGCAATFDPRVTGACPDATGAFPGGTRFCPAAGPPGRTPR
ncbi:MAG: hypothetical protein K8T90_20580 [Planctomycetes bacterium]|nr:hypothetical protein [Planctomycetota bacterium]